jgi:streptogramin lyase
LNQRILAAILVIVTASIMVSYASYTFAGMEAKNKENSTNSNQPSYKADSNLPSVLSTVPIRGTYVTLYPLPNGTAPNSILVDKDGIVWSAGSKIRDLFRFDPNTNSLEEYEIPGEQNDNGYRMSWSMVQDNEGNIWFSQFGDHPIWRFNPSDDTFTSFHSHVQYAPFQMKHDIKTDDIWFTTLSGGSLGVIQKVQDFGPVADQYEVNEFSIGNGTMPSGLYVNGDFIWVTEIEQGKIIKFDAVRTSNGIVTGIKQEAAMPTGNHTPFSIPTDVLLSENGQFLWITEHGPSTVTKYDIISQKSIQFPTAKNKYDVASLPFWLRESTDNKGIWFNEHEGGSIGFLTDNLTLTEFHLQNIPQNSIPFMLNLATDPTNPNKLWFSLWTVDEIGVVDKSVLSPFDLAISKDKVALSQSENHALTHVTIIKNPTANIEDTILLNASSSMLPDGSLENMTAQFSIPMFPMTSQTPNKTVIELTLNDQSLEKGNYTIGLSAGDALITKTVFAYLTVS